MVRACCALILTSVLLSLSGVAQAAFVQRSGTALTLGGNPYRFTGLNLYQAGGNCGYNANLTADFMDWGAGKEVMRTWFFQYGATTLGLRDWTAFDAAIAEAKAANIKIIPVLINQWWHCESWATEAEGYKTEFWYTTGWKVLPTSPGMPKNYRQWIADVAARYKNEDTIAMWQLVNEAEALPSYGGTCNSATARPAIKNFAHNAASVIRNVDPNHLISLGTIGSGQCGTAGSAYQSAHDSPYIDVCGYHDYGDPLTPIPDDGFNRLQQRINQCAALNKPLIVDEVGVRTDAVGTLQARANAYEAKVSAQFAAGIDGFLPWEWRDAAHGGSSSTGLPIGPNDPVLPVLGAH